MGKLLKSILFLAALAIILPANAEEFAFQNGAIVLTDSNIETAAKTYDYLFVTFYAPWSQYSQKYLEEIPTWAKAITNDKYKVTFGILDATKEKQSAKKYDIYKYPMTKLFIRGDVLDYDGPGAEANVTAFLKKKIETNIPKVNTPQDVGKLVDEKGVVLIFFGNKKDQTYPPFRAVSLRFDDIGFVFSKNDDMKKDYRIPLDTKILLIKKFDEGKVPFTGEITLENLNDFILRHRFPYVNMFDDTLGKKIFGEGIPALFLVYEKNEDGEAAEEVMREVASKLKGQILVALSDYGMPRVGKRLANYIEVDEFDLPAIRIVHQKKGGMPKKYIFDKERTVENVLQFVEDYKSGAIKPHLPSQPVPEKNDGPVKVVVAQTFNEIVMDPTKDVFIEFYSEKCFHCKKLAPIWEELGTALASIPNLVIAKIDGQANVFDDIFIPGFPTLKFYPANAKDSPVDYEGDRKTPKFLEWLKDKLTVEYDPSALEYKEKRDEL